MRIVNANTIVTDTPDWITRKWTWKRLGALLMWWIVACFLMPVLHIISQCAMGVIEGIGLGFVRGLKDAWLDVQKYWRMFEECE